MTTFFYSLFFPMLSAAEKTAQSSGGFNWRDVTSLAGIVLPLLLGAFFYLLRKKQEAENELRKQQMQALKEAIKRAQDDADDAIKKINDIVSAHLSHQTTCGVTYISRETYRQDMETQSSHVASMKGTIDTLNNIMVHQQTLVTQLVKSLS